jgi:hypothetical protein
MAKMRNVRLKYLLASLVVFFSFASRTAAWIKPGTHLSISASACANSHAFPFFLYTSRRFSANRLVEISIDPSGSTGPLTQIIFPLSPAAGTKFGQGCSFNRIFPPPLVLPLRL